MPLNNYRLFNQKGAGESLPLFYLYLNNKERKNTMAQDRKQVKVSRIKNLLELLGENNALIYVGEGDQEGLILELPMHKAFAEELWNKIIDQM